MNTMKNYMSNETRQGLVRQYMMRAAMTLVMMVMVLTAAVAQTVTVTFDANGGMGTMKPQTFTAGTPQALKSCEFYNFFKQFVIITMLTYLSIGKTCNMDYHTYFK